MSWEQYTNIVGWLGHWPSKQTCWANSNAACCNGQDGDSLKSCRVRFVQFSFGFGEKLNYQKPRFSHTVSNTSETELIDMVQLFRYDFFSLVQLLASLLIFSTPTAHVVTHCGGSHYRCQYQTPAPRGPTKEQKHSSNTVTWHRSNDFFE